MRFEGKCALVTGAASGVGRSVAEGLAAEGAMVAVADRNASGAAQTVANITDAGGQAMFVLVDVSDPQQVTDMVRQVTTAFGRLDFDVNCAALAHLRRMLDIPPQEWNQVIDVNLTGVFYCAQASARYMAEHGGGRIVNMSSVNGQRAISGRGAYAVAKGGLEMLTRLMAAEFGEFGITVNNVAPAPVDTPMILEMHTEGTRADWHRALPIKRYAQPEEVAAAVFYLLSKEAAYVTGHTLNVDGGFNATGILMDI